MKTYVTKAGTTQFMPALAEIEEMDAEQQGFCLACGATQDGVEPDARKYACEACGVAKVYGAQQLALMGLMY